MRFQGCIAFCLQPTDLRLDLAFVDADDLVMNMGLNSQSLAQRQQQLLLVHCLVAVQSLVINLLGDLPKLGHRLFLSSSIV